MSQGVTTRQPPDPRVVLDDLRGISVDTVFEPRTGVLRERVEFPWIRFLEGGLDRGSQLGDAGVRMAFLAADGYFLAPRQESC